MRFYLICPLCDREYRKGPNSCSSVARASRMDFALAEPSSQILFALRRTHKNLRITMAFRNAISEPNLRKQSIGVTPSTASFLEADTIRQQNRTADQC